MCGLAGAIGPVNNTPFLLTAIKRMEYRGYDSCGYFLRNMDNKVSWIITRFIGPPSQLPWSGYEGEVGLSHTRWASHGAVSYANTHPIEGGNDEDAICVVHNGIVENYQELKEELAQFTFETETDTESLAHLIFRELKDCESADEILKALDRVSDWAVGRYSAVATYREAGQVNGLFLISNDMPLYVCEKYGLVASDPIAFSGFVPDSELITVLLNNVAFLGHSTQGAELYVLRNKDYLDYVSVSPLGDDLVSGPGERMRAEINEQVGLFGSGNHPRYDMRGGPLLMFGCGSSYHAALFGTYIFDWFGQQAFASLPSQLHVNSLLGSELPWRHLAITQSGETADVLNMLPLFLDCFLLTNRPHSSAAVTMGNAANIIEMDCGQELAVAATKSFTATCLRLFELALERANFESPDYSGLREDIYEVIHRPISRLVIAAASARRIYVAGNVAYHPIALEGALKLKECTYRHAEGICLGEVKHGPLAAMDKQTLVIASVLTDRDLANLSEIWARGVSVFVLTNKNISRLIDVPHFVLPELSVHVGNCEEGFHDTTVLSPLAHLFILQRLAYELAMASGIDPDRPRNIAKSLTV